MRELTIHDIETIIRSDENRILEVKKTTGEIDAGMSSGCAFLNTDGGWLLFGIAPKSLKILGQDVTDPTKQEIANHLRKFDPLINPYVQYVDVPESDGKKVIAIYFDPAEYSDVPYSYDGRPYYKVENTTTLMPRQLFERLIRENHPEKFSWEKEICHKAILEDLDAKRIRGTIQAGVNVGRIPSSAVAGWSPGAAESPTLWKPASRPVSQNRSSSKPPGLLASSSDSRPRSHHI